MYYEPHHNILYFRKELLEATYVESEIAFARTQGAFTLPNPLAVVKDEGEQTHNTLMNTLSHMHTHTHTHTHTLGSCTVATCQ